MDTAMTAAKWRAFAAANRPDVRPLIDGRRTDPSTEATFDVIDPPTGECVAALPACDQADVDKAVDAARRSFSDGAWSTLAPRLRSQALRRFAEVLLRHGDELRLLDSRQMGAPIGSMVCNAAGYEEIVGECAEQADKLQDVAILSAPMALALNLRRPHGVVGAISPWNAPAHTALMKVVPAIAMGNSVVLKPSELAPLACLRMADLALEAGIPAGVFNVVPGLGPQAGRALALHRDVDFLTFTGSTATGQLLMQYAGQSNLKGLMLECGGKSPHLVFDDLGDLNGLADALVQGFTVNSGQVCSAGTRILVADNLYERLLSLLVGKVQATSIGDPLDAATLMGPLASAGQFARVQDLLGQARRSDTLVAQGQARSASQGGSANAFAARLYTSSDAASPLVQEEIFGPVATVMRFSDEAQALALANGTRYGLVATVWTRDFEQSRRTAAALRAGVVVTNAVVTPAPAHSYFMTAEPVGMSGFGAGAGPAGLLAYTRWRCQLHHLA
jgi:acyl-CoA reductase-like NAD-dependent aldehyde dehydrogenase